MRTNTLFRVLCAVAVIAVSASCKNDKKAKIDTPAEELAIPINPKCPYPIESFDTDHGQVNIYCIKHGSLAIVFNADIKKDSRTILIDPVGDMYGQPVDYSTVPKGDIIVITHEHGDHLSPTTIDARSAKDAQIILNQASYDEIGKGTVMANGDSRSLSSAIKVKAVPAYNTGSKSKDFHPKGNGNGYIFTIDGFSIYVAGDTEPYVKMKKFGDIDVAFLPVNQPYTMTPEQCVKAAKYVGAKLTIPYHTGDTDLAVLGEALSEVRIHYVMHEELK